MTKKKNNKLLSTSINKKTSSLMDDFNSSIDVDQRLIEEDILVTQAHVGALEKLKVISKIEAKKIHQGLNGILSDYQKRKIKFSKKNEDIHMNVEYFLHQRIGDIALKIHTGRSRNDQVATDTRLWTKKSAKEIQKLIKMVMRSIFNQANKHQETIIPGSSVKESKASFIRVSSIPIKAPVIVTSSPSRLPPPQAPNTRGDGAVPNGSLTLVNGI